MDNKIQKSDINREIAQEKREIIRIVCASNGVQILAGHVGKDHIHLLVSVPHQDFEERKTDCFRARGSGKAQCHTV